MGQMSIYRGYYVNPAKPDEEILVESTKSVQNRKGSEIQRVVEQWIIDRPGSPPRQYKRTTYSSAYLPGIGGYSYYQGPRKVQEEETDYWAFTPLAGNNPENLGKTRRISGYVVYDQPENPTAPTDGDTTNALAQADITPGPVRDRIFHTGRLWSEANHMGNVIPEEGHNQWVEWVPNVIVEHDLVDEEWDRWIVTTVTKNALKPGDVEISEPREIKKDNIRYQLPVPLDPPEIEVIAGHNGNKVEIAKGGAVLKGWWQWDLRILPENYKLYRAVLSEPDRTENSDWQDWWKDGDEPPPRIRTIIEDTAVTELDGGAPADPLPPGSGHTEPHDPEPPEPPPEIYFELIATLDNIHDRPEEGLGYAEFLDPDIEANGEYEYFATCTWGDDESPDSNHVIVTASGSPSRSYRIALRTGVEDDVSNGVLADHIDILAPDDPGLIDPDLGSTMEFEVPVPEDPLQLAEEIADRQFAERVAATAIKFDTLSPIPGLEFGAAVTLPNVAWAAFNGAAGIRIDSQTVSERYVLVGFERWAERDVNGEWSTPVTTLTLQEYPR
jgi:hypothetical protein